VKSRSRLCTSARYSNGYWTASKTAEAAGDGRTFPIGLVSRLRAMGFLLFERALIVFRPLSGDEIVLIARKPADKAS
jgi:hypothetical protein